MSELPNTNSPLFELPVTNTGIDGMVAEYQEATRAQLEGDRAAIQAGIEAKFSAHQDLVQPGEDGAEVLTLQMPWQGGGAKRPEAATVTLSRRKDAAGNTSTDMTFSAKRAWTSRATAVTVGGETRVRGGDDLDYEHLVAETWRENIELAQPATPGLGRRRLFGGFLGHQATKN